MKDETKFREMYGKLMDYQNSIHERNQKRIKIGLWCIYIIPAIFLFLLLLTDSSKIVFLVLWIASLFGIAIFLICVEYYDYNLQEKMNEISGRKDISPETLINVDDMEEKISGVAQKIESRGGLLQ